MFRLRARLVDGVHGRRDATERIGVGGLGALDRGAVDLEPGALLKGGDETSFVVTGHGALQAPAAPLYLGNAGTATRFLTAAVATADGIVVVDGDDHMRKRPIGPLVTALNSLGINTEPGSV